MSSSLSLKNAKRSVGRIKERSDDAPASVPEQRCAWSGLQAMSDIIDISLFNPSSGTA